MSMTLWEKIGAAIGATVGRPLDALSSGLASLIERIAPGSRAERNQVAFTIALIALSAKMAKADGIVVPAEIAAFRRVVLVPDGEVENVARIFDLAKRDVAGFESYSRQVRDLLEEPLMLEEVLDGLFHIAKADGVLHEREGTYLRQVAEIFGFEDFDYRRIRARHVADPFDPYLVLGVAHDASEDELRRRYRALVKENHPDRLIALGLPEACVRIATDKLAAINAAYKRVATERASEARA
jgi:DnaJ like chaperone protein